MAAGPTGCYSQLGISPVLLACSRHCPRGETRRHPVQRGFPDKGYLWSPSLRLLPVWAELWPDSSPRTATSPISRERMDTIRCGTRSLLFRAKVGDIDAVVGS